jgi:hypothetical protein
MLTNHMTCVDVNIVTENKVKEIGTTKLIGLHIDGKFTWKMNTEYMIPKPSSACFSMRTVT